MPALSIAHCEPPVVDDVDKLVAVAELDWLEMLLFEARTAVRPADDLSMRRFEAAWTRLERLTVALGMPENGEASAADWAEDYLRSRGRRVEVIPALIVGTPEYRRRHIAMLWQAQLWHEAIMILAVAGLLGFAFYAIAQGIQSWM